MILYYLLRCSNTVQALLSYSRCGALLYLFLHTANVCSGEVMVCVCVLMFVCVCERVCARACSGEVNVLSVAFQTRIN